MIKRRFIAGAVCSECGAMDKVVMYDDAEDQRVRECVACGHKDLLSEQPSPDASSASDRALYEPLLVASPVTSSAAPLAAKPRAPPSVKNAHSEAADADVQASRIDDSNGKNKGY